MPSCGRRYAKTCYLYDNCYEWEDDGAAFLYLKEQGHVEEYAEFCVRVTSESISEKELAALCFLVNEWDWYVRDWPQDE